MRITTNDSIGNIINFFCEKGINTIPEDWTLVRKYKNFSGKTCRDFFHKTKEIQCIFVDNDGSNSFEIIEGANFEYFLLSEKEGYFFYYLPTLTKDGIVFYFEPKIFIDNGTIATEEDIPKYREFLRKKLLLIFPENDISGFDEKLFFSFVGGDYQVVMNKLEKAKITFNINLYANLNKNEHILFVDSPNKEVFKHFQDEKISQEKAINKILTVFSKKTTLHESDFAEIKFFLKKINLEETRALKKIASTFKNGKNPNVLRLFYEAEKIGEIKEGLPILWEV